MSVTEDNRYEVGSPGELISAQLSELRDELDLLGLNKDEFVNRSVENVPEPPPNYERVIEINTGTESPKD